MFFLVKANNRRKKVLVLDTDDLEIEWIPFETMLGYMRNGVVVKNAVTDYTENLYDTENGYSGFYSSAGDYLKYYQKVGKLGISVDFSINQFLNKVLVSDRYNAIIYAKGIEVEAQYNNYFFKVEYLVVGRYAEVNSYIVINGKKYFLCKSGIMLVVKVFGIDTNGRLNLTFGYNSFEDNFDELDVTVTLYKDGTVSVRKLGLSREQLGIPKDYITSKRTFLLRG